MENVHKTIKNLGGTMVGVGLQQNFSFGIHGNFDRVVIDDINPVVTEVFVPFIGYIAQQAGGERRKILEALLGVPITETDVKNLFEPDRSQVTRENLEKYVMATLTEIVERVPLEERQRQYQEHIMVILEEQIFARLRKLGRVTGEDELSKAKDVFFDFLEPDTLLDKDKNTQRNIGGQKFQL